MSKIGKGFLVVDLIGFVLIGFFLLTNHWGLAIKVGNYVFLLLLGDLLYEIFKK